MHVCSNLWFYPAEQELSRFFIGTMYLLISEDHNTSDVFSVLGWLTFFFMLLNFLYLLTEKKNTAMLP